MNLQLFLPLITTVVIAIVGWYIVHYFTAQRDRDNRRRDELIRYRIGAYRTLAKAVEHRQLYLIADEVQSAIADIQLFGTPAQIDMVGKVVQEVTLHGDASLKELLQALRDDLRAELQLLPVNENIWWIRIIASESSSVGV